MLHLIISVQNPLRPNVTFDCSSLKTPDYAVSVSGVQPEARAEMDETWDYDYEESKEFVGASASATKALGYFEVII